ncbi:MAG: transcriptional regulator, TraR/DksA family [Frankiales bacterium]|nr:transcriptional regulator, TraR/DksA family [Frankiales bacterium]
MDVQDARQQLEQMLHELDTATTTLEHEGAGDSAELSHVDQHPGDNASDLVDQDRENALLEAAEGQREQIRAALQRLDDGTFGTCVDCGVAISEARLMVRPEAARCVECQSKAEDAA